MAGEKGGGDERCLVAGAGKHQEELPETTTGGSSFRMWEVGSPSADMVVSRRCRRLGSMGWGWGWGWGLRWVVAAAMRDAVL